MIVFIEIISLDLNIFLRKLHLKVQLLKIKVMQKVKKKKKKKKSMLILIKKYS